MSEERTVSLWKDRLDFLSEFIQTYPDLPVPTVSLYRLGDSITLDWHIDTPYGLSTEEAATHQREEVRKVTRTLRGQWDKETAYSLFALKKSDRQLGESGEHFWVHFSIYADRSSVCERRVVGTEEVTIPAVEAQPERVETQEIVEWDCGSLYDESRDQVSAEEQK